MRVAVYYNNHDIRIKDMPRPKVGAGELLIRVEACGICGSDTMEWYRIDKTPLVLGHEISGIIDEVGAGVLAYKRGERVSCAHHVPCGECRYCLSGHETVCDTLRRSSFDPGGFSEYLRLAKINVDKGVYLLPDTLSFEEATFIEPLACVIRGQRLAGRKNNSAILVIGNGIAGLLHICLAKIKGACRVVAVDISDYRLEAAKKFGADMCFDAREFSAELFRGVNDGRLADLVIVATTATPAINQAFASVERGGTILFFAPVDKGAKIPLPFNELFWRNEITLTSSYAGGPRDYKEALDLLGNREMDVSKLITHRLGLSEVALGFSLVAAAGESIKVIINTQE